MKKIIAILLLAALSFPLWAQNSLAGEKTILFLIPFYSNKYDSQVLSNVKDCDDLKTIGAFQLMGFWAGAQVALDEFNAENVHLNVIVKDITDSETKLRSIMENKALMEKVDLIVGPFFSKQFAIAAQYAKTYKIPIVNPFTTRIDILKDNEYVYKLMPTLETRASTVAFMADMYPKHQIILYADSAKSAKEYEAYTKYFRANNIKFKTVSLQKAIVPELQSDGQNIIVVLTSESAKMLMMSRDLIFKSNLDNLTLIVPEDWFDVVTYDIEYYSKLNIHFFSDYYVDNKSEKVQVFIHDYTSKFNAPPTLDAFSYQGYDVTRYFVSALYNDMDLDRVKIETLGFHFSFDKVPAGGYENINTTFLEVVENEIQPADF